PEDADAHRMGQGACGYGQLLVPGVRGHRGRLQDGGSIGCRAWPYIARHGRFLSLPDSSPPAARQSLRAVRAGFRTKSTVDDDEYSTAGGYVSTLATGLPGRVHQSLHPPTYRRGCTGTPA